MNHKTTKYGPIVICCFFVFGCDGWAIWETCPDERLKGKQDNWKGCLCQDDQLDNPEHVCFDGGADARDSREEPDPESAQPASAQAVWRNYSFSVSSDTLPLGTVSNCEPFRVLWMFDNISRAKFVAHAETGLTKPLVVLGSVSGTSEYVAEKIVEIEEPWEETPPRGVWASDEDVYFHANVGPDLIQLVDPPEFSSGPDGTASFAYDVRMLGVSTTAEDLPTSQVNNNHRATCP